MKIETRVEKMELPYAQFDGEVSKTKHFELTCWDYLQTLFLNCQL